jgi:16S rRNA (guanine966-N2)-methyltransferase
MKDRLREALFNILGPAVQGKHALDLFAGTGALGIEALSRGALRATLIEQHRPTAALVRQNLVELGVAEKAEVVVGNVFIWWRRCQGSGGRVQGSGFRGQGSGFRVQGSGFGVQGSGDRVQGSGFGVQGSGSADNPEPEIHPSSVILHPSSLPWLVFCSPPYAFYVERSEEMRELIGGLLRAAPADSIFVVEADDRFDFQSLPEPAAWDVRAYPPAVVGIRRVLPAASFNELPGLPSAET